MPHYISNFVTPPSSYRYCFLAFHSPSDDTQSVCYHLYCLFKHRMTYKILFCSDILLHYKLKNKIVLKSLKSLSWPPDDNTPPIYYSYTPYDYHCPQFWDETKATTDNKKATTTIFTSQLITHQIKPRFKLTPFTYHNKLGTQERCNDLSARLNC